MEAQRNKLHNHRLIPFKVALCHLFPHPCPSTLSPPPPPPPPPPLCPPVHLQFYLSWLVLDAVRCCMIHCLQYVFQCDHYCQNLMLGPKAMVWAVLVTIFKVGGGGVERQAFSHKNKQTKTSVLFYSQYILARLLKQMSGVVVFQWVHSICASVFV